MKHLPLIFVASFLLVFASPVQGQTFVPTPTVVNPSFGDFLSNLIGGLFQRKTDERVSDINKANLPFEVRVTPASNPQPSGSAQSTSATTNSTGESVVYNAASQYAVASSLRNPESMSTNVGSSGSFWSSIADVLGFGNKRASQFASSQLPKEVGEKALSQLNNQLNQENLASGNLQEKVLGVGGADAAMLAALPLAQCTNLPFGAGTCANNNNPITYPTLTPAASIPTVLPTCGPGGGSGGGGGDGGTCALGDGPCSVENLKTYFGGDETKAKKASQICNIESGSQEEALNDDCLIGTTADYSVGLFQINLLPAGRCPGALEKDSANPNLCRIVDQAKLDACVAEYFNPENNIQAMLRLSGNGTNWQPWRNTIKKCGISATSQSIGVTFAPPAGGSCSQPIPQPGTGYGKVCPAQSEMIGVPGTSYDLMNVSDNCITPRIIVIHWVGGWLSARAVKDVLIDRGLSCQLATDTQNQLQLLQYYDNGAQWAHCASAAYNSQALNNEISGVYFDSVFNNPNHPHYQDLVIETDRAIQSTCWMMQKYNIPLSGVVGHYQIKSDKQDPGPAYLQYFKNRLFRECKLL